MKVIYLILLSSVNYGSLVVGYPLLLDGMFNTLSQILTSTGTVVESSAKAVGDGIEGGFQVASGLAQIPIATAAIIETGANVVGAGVDLGVAALSTAAQIPMAGIEATGAIVGASADIVETGVKVVADVGAAILSVPLIIMRPFLGVFG